MMLQGDHLEMFKIRGTLHNEKMNFSGYLMTHIDYLYEGTFLIHFIFNWGLFCLNENY